MGGGLSSTLGERSLRKENWEELTQISQALRNNSRELTKLDLSNRYLGLEGSQFALETLARNKVLTDLNISYNNLGCAGKKGTKTPDQAELPITHISDSLCTNNTLKVLNLAGNNLGVPGCRSIVKLLINNKSIKSLSLYNNYLNDTCAEELSRALMGNSSLTKLNLDYNDITDKGVEFILKSFQSNTSLMELTLKENDGVSRKWMKEVENHLLQNKEKQLKLQAEAEERERREAEEQRAAEEEMKRREAEIAQKRLDLEREYQLMEAQKNREREELERIRAEEEERRAMKSAAREAKQLQEEDHLQNLVKLAYAWREAIRGGERRGREWKNGFQAVPDTSYSIKETFKPSTATPKSRLKPCWCEPADQTVPYAGSLHYHCLNEPDYMDQFGDSGGKKYEGCKHTAHRCASAPSSDYHNERNKDTLFGSAKKVKNKVKAAMEE